MSYIEIKNVSKSYKDKKVLENISLKIDKGKFVSIIGSYGSGKTTLLKMISGLEKIDEGQILINGFSPDKLKEELKMGFVFQDPMLLPWRNVIDNITLPSEINGEKAIEEAKKLLKLVDLESKEKCYPRELSGGMQRIVSILRASIMKPSVLLLDEPLSSIDEINRDDLHEKLIKIHEKNKQTTLLVTHSIHEAVYLSDEIYVLGGSPTRILKRIVPKKPRRIENKFSSNTMIEVADVFHPAEYLFPSLGSVAKSFIENYQEFLENTMYTIIEVIVGFGIAVALGLFLAIITVHYTHLEQILTFSAIILKTIPIIAIAPLLVLWFGHGMGSKIAAVTITSFIPILINVLSGAKEILYKYKSIIGLYNMNKKQKTKYFILPGIRPYLMSSLKISSSLAIVGALVSELISANKGIGYLIMSNYYSMNIAGVFVCIILSSLIGIGIYSIFDKLEKTQDMI